MAVNFGVQTKARAHHGDQPGEFREIGVFLPENPRQHRTLHIQKNVLPYALCPVSAALASISTRN